MLDAYILTKLEPLKDERMILLRDPQRMIQRGARAVDGWGEENGFTVLFCSGNLALRERLRAMGSDPDNRILLVDITREDGKLFYPDLEAATPPKARISITLRDFLIEKTGDTGWPHLVNERNLSRLMFSHLKDTLDAHDSLRSISPTRFTDSDFYKIVIGGVLQINPFKNLTANEIRRICLTQHASLDELNKVLPQDSRKYIEQLIQSAPEPFCWLLERDPETIVRAFTLSAMLHQHGLDYSLLLSNIDPGLHEYRGIEQAVLDEALNDQLSADPDQVLSDVRNLEEFLLEKPERISFLLNEQLKIDEKDRAEEVLKKECLSALIRSLALGSLLFNLVTNLNWKDHARILKMLEAQEQDANFLVLRRPTDQWKQLITAYRRAISIYELLAKLSKWIADFKVKPANDIDFAIFNKLWNEDKLNRLDYYISEMERLLRVGEILPVPSDRLWKSYLTRWEEARKKFKETSGAVEDVFKKINSLFQDLYHKNYTKWILQEDSPVIFTHQFLSRMLKAYWDPKSGQKAVVLVFDGLRTDAWEEFVRPVMEERFDVIANRPGSALIPTETELSRKAISAGALPLDFPGKSRQELAMLKAWLSVNLRITPDFSIVCDDDTRDSGMTVRYNSKELDYVVFNFTDGNLHHNNQDLSFIYNNTVREIIRQDVRAVMRDIPSDAMVFITSDHGFTAMPGKNTAGAIDVDENVVNNSKQVKYSSVRAAHKMSEEEMKKVVSFDIRALKIPIPNEGGDPVQFVFFPRPGYIFMRDKYGSAPDRFSHGGVSLSECMIPMVVMGPRITDNGVLTLDAIIQVGSTFETDPMELIIRVRSREIITEPFTLTLAFAQQDIPDRKEIFLGVEKEFNIQWKPSLPEITPDDNARGYLEIPLTVTLSHRVKEKVHRQTKTIDLRVRIDTTRLHRRIDSKLDLMMGKMPKEIKG